MRTGARIRSVLARGVGPAIALAVLLASSTARAEVAEASPRPETAFDFMNLLAHHGLHDLADEDWNAYGQLTNIWTLKPAFSAKYTNCAPTSVTGCTGTPNSLIPTQELSFTETATVYIGMRLWPGAEAYFVPEVISEKELSNLHGLGGVIQNFELQKQGTVNPTPYLSRSYITQTIELGGKRIDRESNPMQLARVDRSRRLVLTVGNYSVLDFFDQNNVSGDLRRSFLNMAFLTYAAYDFAADARGYAWGGLAELDYDDWTFRVARMTPPKNPNDLPLDFHLFRVYGDQFEIEHAHHLFGGDGAVRLLGYRNVENMGKFSDAITAFESNPAENAAACGDRFNYNSTNPQAPDLCWVRRSNVKLGLGFSVEQQLFGDVGVFFRGMYSDGQTEVYSFTSTDRSISFGAVAHGDRWHREADTLGLGWSQGWISHSHAEYLGMGGVDAFIGDGRIRQASESVLEVFYSLSLGSSAWASLDYQFIRNPAYNADRGPVNIAGARVHVEF